MVGGNDYMDELSEPRGIICVVLELQVKPRGEASLIMK